MVEGSPGRALWRLSRDQGHPATDSRKDTGIYLDDSFLGPATATKPLRNTERAQSLRSPAQRPVKVAVPGPSSSQSTKSPRFSTASSSQFCGRFDQAMTCALLAFPRQSSCAKCRTFRTGECKTDLEKQKIDGESAFSMTSRIKLMH